MRDPNQATQHPPSLASQCLLLNRHWHSYSNGPFREILETGSIAYFVRS